MCPPKFRLGTVFWSASSRGRSSSPTAAWAPLLSAAVPRLRCPEEANLRAPGRGRLTPRELHQRRRGPDRDEHVRREPAQARRTTSSRTSSNRSTRPAVKLARDAREMTGRDVFIGGSIGPLGEPATSRVRRELFAEQAAVLDGRGADVFMVETFYDLEELVDAVEAVRSVSSLPIVALLTFDEGAETLAGVTRGRGGRAAARARRRRDRRESRRRPARRARRARADGQATEAARGAPEHRAREPDRRPRHLPARDARVLRASSPRTRATSARR